MAPITEKRMPQQQQKQEQIHSSALPYKEDSNGIITANMGATQAFIQNAFNHSHGHGHGHPHHNSHYHQHAKENAASNRRSRSTNNSRNGLEILDFRESWREEVEMYKESMYGKKQILLSSRHHARKPQGCPLEMNVCANNFPHVTRKHNNNNNVGEHATTTSSLSPTATGKSNGSNAKRNISIVKNATTTLSLSPTVTGQSNGSSSTVSGSNAKRNISIENKSRFRGGTTVKSAADSFASNQRPREELPSKAASGAKYSSSPSSKRSGHSSSPPAYNYQVSDHAYDSRLKNNAATTVSHNTKNNPPTTSTAKNNIKIIVNQFHASSLLNGHHYEEKEMILTQNGLTNPQSSTAYEASFYAANYLTPDARNANSYKNQYHANSDAAHGLADDDPCAAIDDVNTYTESDSEEEYTGDTFFIGDEATETQQSKNIRHPSSIKDDNTATTTETPKYTNPQCILSASLFPNVPPYLNFCTHLKAGPELPPQLRRILKWKLSPVMPQIVKRVVLNSGFRIIKNTTDWMAVWEKHMKSPGFKTIRSNQKYNHVPGSFRIGRKDSIWRNLHQLMKKFGNKEFGFMQRSFILPDDLEDLRQAWPLHASRQSKWIIKPPASARGAGISVVNKWSQFPKDRPLVVQKYIERPLLINDNKFDMRLYVVMTSINPLRIYMYKEGLARFAAVKYSSELNSLDERCMHLTNYSINKFSSNYTKNEDVNACQGHKWSLQSLWSYLEGRGVNTKHLWAALRNLVIRAIISGESGLNRSYRHNVNSRYNCYELFGFDVLLDENLIPWLLEINISPSLHSELPLDLHIKGPLIQCILNTVLYQVPQKLNEKTQADILKLFNLKGPLCHDRRIFTTCLRNDEIRKHNHFTNRSIECREEYLEAILDNLNPDDVRCLIISEDELNRSSPMERIFPTANTYKYSQFIEHPRYYNRLLDAWENRYGDCRQEGIELLRGYCNDNYHLNVSDTALEKEPNIALTEIDLFHVKQPEEPELAIDDTSILSTDAIIDDNKTTTSKEIDNDVFNSVYHLLNESKIHQIAHASNSPQNLNKLKTKTNESTGKSKTEN